jgi:hypothetical protein
LFNIHSGIEHAFHYTLRSMSLSRAC